jgi:hypothetical protein
LYAAKLKRLMGKNPDTGKTVKDLDKRKDAITKQLLAGRLTEEAYEEYMDDIANQLARLQESSATTDSALSAVGRYAGRPGVLRRDWEKDEKDGGLSLDRKQAIIRAVIDHVVIAPVGKGGNRFDSSRVGEPQWR